MNIVSYNVRGLGRGVKWAAVRRVIKKENVDFICLQETKKESIDKGMCQAIWGSADVSWELQPATNSAGGIRCMWNNNAFKLQNKVVGNGFIFLEGEWTKEAQQVKIISIYSPCDMHNKRILWESVRQLKESSQRGLWCVLGDFNSIRAPAKRIGTSDRGSGVSNIKEFNDWIDDLEVLEIPCLGKQFT